MIDLALLAGGVLGNVAGAKAAEAMGVGSNSGMDYEQLLNQYNKYLTSALNSSLGYSQDFTNQAIQSQGKGLTNATNAFNQGYQNAQNWMIPYTNLAFNSGQALMSPYNQAGQLANNAYAASLGLNTGAIPSYQDSQQAYLKQQAQLLQQQLGLTSAPTNPGNAPATAKPLLADYASKISRQQAQDYFNKNTTYSQGAWDFTGGGLNTRWLDGVDGGAGKAFDQNFQGIQNALAQTEYQKALKAYNAEQSTYNKNLENYNKYQDFIKSTGYDPNYQTNAQQGGTGQQGAGSNQGLSNFLNSPQYQALFGNAASQQHSQTGQYDPTQAFQQDPGTKFAIDQAMKTLNQQAASKGLLSSGSLQQQLLTTAQGIQNQKYQEYQNQLAGTFNQYQNQLAGYTTLGSQLTGANTAASLYSNLGNNLGQMAFGTGQQIGNANLNVYENIASLLANQGSLGASAYLNTGGAQANGLLNIAGMAAQQQGANNASAAQSYSSQLANQGALQAANYLQSSPFAQNNNQTANPMFGATGGRF